MKRVIAAGCALVLTATAAAPAMAGDLMFNRKAATTLTEGSIGQPWWKLQAQCAGMFAAAFNSHSLAGEADLADIDRDIGKSMLTAAIDRLERDRGMDHKVAVDLALLQVSYGRDRVTELIRTGGSGPTSPWNTQRSICMDIHEAYTGKFG
ncbi:MAG: hypothetical protein KF842_08920 [Caulobacter sp.]|nr:hypothetical protein [Caulobacter sp.]